MRKYEIVEINILSADSNMFYDDFSELKRSDQIAGGAAWWAEMYRVGYWSMSRSALANFSPIGLVINARLLKALAADDARSYYAVIPGKTKWYAFNDAHLQERIKFHIAYERRSEREKRVALRSKQIFNYLTALEKKVYGGAE